MCELVHQNAADQSLVGAQNDRRGNLNANESAGKLARQHTFVDTAMEAIARRARLVTGSQQVGDQVRRSIEQRVDQWLAQTEVQSNGAILGYQVQGKGGGGRIIGLLKKPTDEDWDTFTCLNSLRDVEPNVPLVLKDGGMDRPSNAIQERPESEEAT